MIYPIFFGPDGFIEVSLWYLDSLWVYLGPTAAEGSGAVEVKPNTTHVNPKNPQRKPISNNVESSPSWEPKLEPLIT